MKERQFGPLKLIPGANRGRHPYSNSVYVEGAGVLIDAGADEARYRELIAGPGVKEIWLSHWHEDHCTYLDLFAGLPLTQMEIEAEALTDIEVLIDWYGISDEEHRARMRNVIMSDFHFKPRRATRYFTPGETIDLGVCTVQIIPAPGHTPGSVVFFFPEPAVCFLGDYDLTRFGPWYADRDSSIDDTIMSLRRLQQLPVKTWLTGHEDGCFEGDATAAFDAYLAVIDEREAKLLDFLSQPRSMDEIVAACIVYRKPREPKIFYEWSEGAFMGKHLDRLMKRGAVTLENGRYRRVT